RKVNWGQVGNAALTGCMMGMAGEALSAFMAARGTMRAGSCLARNSFTADTPVLMADGTRKPIRDIKTGDKVLATDPQTGETGPRTVTTLIEGNGEKQLVDLTIDTGQARDTKNDHITATEGHPFWAPELRQWVDAVDLKSGQWLQTSAGTWVQITAVRHRTQSTAVYNLTVDDLHTYYVQVGRASALVHNCGPSGDLLGYAEFLRPHGGKGGGVVYAAKYTSPSGRSYFGYNASGLHPKVGGLLDRAVRTVGKRGHIGCAETMCLVLAERAEGESALLNGVMEAVRVRGLKSGGTAHGTSAHPCVGTCQPRLDWLGIDHIG
ncbi:polymorphic toxin-type HINT domain-containing protein, partial [Streptomyces sp. NPDC088928]|uniref:polymorphic toxin-type HINT domain-containing protein n=1 Tax=Streptomyces sp. NPDC088928 TaxID=3365915 RepID=UPI0037FFCA68